MILLEIKYTSIRCCFLQNHIILLFRKKDKCLFILVIQNKKDIISVIEIPEGYTIESFPKPMKISTDGKELFFLINTVSQGNKIQILVTKEINIAIVSC